MPRELTPGAVVYKLTGSGNDFVFADGRNNPAESWPAEQIRQLCDRRTGLGADGFAVVAPGSAPGKVRFTFFNCDGSQAPMCGNGALCATRIARWLEIVNTDDMILETGAGDVPTSVVAHQEWRSLLQMDIDPQLVQPDIPLANDESSIYFTTIGVPHAVILVGDLDSAPVFERGREIRNHPEIGPLGANVNFVARTSDSWAMRTYERGVEAETLACGTGAVACAAVLLRLGEIALPWNVFTRSGRTLTISGTQTKTGSLRHPSIQGEARIVFRAVLLGRSGPT